MAIVAHTPYNGNTDCGRTNEYLCDGHGLPPVDRTNRYISDGHGGHTICEGYNCPADPQLATEYMNTLRLNYERQHPVSEGRTKGCVTHEQIYVSPSEEDNVPPDERMEMMRELIERSVLRDFASIYVPHDNTKTKHGHISTCPYSVDGTHKLCLNAAVLNDLRRTMDRICVEHGYSIVENPELWADKEYRQWFFDIKEQGIVKVLPPKEQDMTSYKQDRKRARTYSASKQAQAARKQREETYYAQLTKGVTKADSDRVYASPLFYNPQQPHEPLIIKKYAKNGQPMSEMELAAASLFVWAKNCGSEIQRRKIRGSTSLQNRMQNLATKALSARDIMRDLDIKTHAELIGHIKECGGDIAQLKQEIKRQDTIMARMADVMDAIDRWENQKDPEAYAYLKSHHCGTPDEIADAKKRYARAVGRKETAEAYLTDRSTEYRHLKEAESIINPASSEQLWHEYLEQMFSKEIEKKIGFADMEKLEKQLHQMGKVAGLSREEVDRLIDNAKRTASKKTWVEHRAFMKMTFTQDEYGHVSAIYDEIRDAYDDIRRYRRLQRTMPVFGPITLILSLIITMRMQEKLLAKEREIEQLRWQAEVQKEYAKEARRERQLGMEAAMQAYKAETYQATEAEIQAARIRYYEAAARIHGRLDILFEIIDMQNAGCLDHQIEQAVRKRLDLEIDIPPARELERE